MVKLLIIADDFTGALDTGVQFAASGAETRVGMNTEYNFEYAESSVQVFVLNAETRHLKPEEAYQLVLQIVKRALLSGIPYIYKKTDSALRGNIGSELKAVLDAASAKTLHFLPALPKMNRITENGIHYIDAVPVHESVFGRDPFEPVTCSYIPDIIKDAAPVTVVKSLENWKETPGIMVYDAATDRELYETGKLLMEHNQLRIMAGCAGFAAALPALLGLVGQENRVKVLGKHFLVACGSVNPITVSQLDFAEKNGFNRIRLTPEQKLKDGYFETPEGRTALKSWRDICIGGKSCILDTNDLPGSNETLEWAERKGITLEELRVKISGTLGFVVKELVEMGVDSTLFITGGDCLMGFMEHIECHEIKPVCELAPGIVLSNIEAKGRKLQVISKSGGFGGEKLLLELSEHISGDKEEKQYADKIYA